MVDIAPDLGSTKPRFTTRRLRQNQSWKTPYRMLGKRLFDIVFTLCFLPLIGCVIGVLWCLVRLDGGPGFFGHRRVGKNGQTFRCWKLRTMSQTAEVDLRRYLEANPKAAKEWERDHKLSHDPRVTPLGRFLRQTSLDELPQFWNVLFGQMSLVGPRPVVTAELEKYGDYATGYLSMKPGVTGLWQISGRNSVSYDDRVAMDMSYRGQISFALDAIIVCRTAMAVLQRTGQ